MQREINPVEQLSKQRKVRDTIHGFISFPKKIWNFIDSPEFQRLKNIKQLGTLYYVFPGATHTRFQHCLGVGHLAKTYMKILMQNHQERQFGYYIYIRDENGKETKIDYEATIKHQQRILFQLTLAGVMHDLGHGPFSHVFDGIIIKQEQKNQLKKKRQEIDLKKKNGHQITQEDQKQLKQLQKKWSHQDASQYLLDIICDNLYEKHLLDQDDKKSIIRVKQLIQGVSGPEQKRPWEFQLIANKCTGIDVDKLDYFQRDSYHLGAQIFIDNNLLFTESRIKTIRQGGKWKKRISFPTKYAGNVISIFHSRYQLYKYYYLNYKAGGIQAMIIDILKSDSPQYWEACKQLKKKNGQKYIKLTDYVLAQIQNRPIQDEKYQKFKSKIDQLNKQGIKIKFKSKETEQIINRLKRRQIYRLVGVFKCIFNNVDSAEVAKKIFDKFYIQQQLPKQAKVKPDNISIVIDKVTFGEQKKNLIEQVCLFDKEKQLSQIQQNEDETKKQKIENYTMLHTDYFIERVASIYLKDNDEEENKAINDNAKDFLIKRLKEQFQSEKLKLQEELKKDKLQLGQNQYKKKQKQYESKKANLNEQQADKCQYIPFRYHITNQELSARISSQKQSQHQRVPLGPKFNTKKQNYQQQQ